MASNRLFTKENILRTLQGWIFVVGLVALFNTVTCFVDHAFMGKLMYTRSPDKANDLAARLFGLWTFVSGILRIACGIFITNKPLYHLTFVSFIVAFLHYITEVFVYKTAPLNTGVVTPLIVSSLSITGMLIGYLFMNRSDDIPEMEDMPRRVEDIRFSLKKGHHKKAD